MAKYIDAEKLIAEIDSIWRYYLNRDEYDYGFNDALDKVKAFITSLQQEQPHFADASKMEQPKVDLEKAIEDYYGNIPDDEDNVKAARHFYELGLNARKEEYIRKDALLEWAKEKQEQMKIEAGGCSNMLAAGKLLAYKEIVEKIKSL